MIIKYGEYYNKVISESRANADKNGKLYQHSFNDTFKKIVCDQTAKVCVFCATPFTIDNLNQQCSNNRTFKITCVYSSPPGKTWEDVIASDIRGSKRHFWVKSESVHRKKPTL